MYLDETWFNTHDVKTKGLSDSILHVDGENGWVTNGLLISAKKIKKCSADYHEDMTGALFEKWFQKQLLRNILEGTVIVIDNAPSHSRLLEKVPNTSFRKMEILEFLERKNVTIAPETKTKNQLLQLVATQHFQKTYITDEMARSRGCEVLRLPPYFCILTR